MSYEFITRVNAELKRRHKGLTTSVGWKERSAHTQAPSVSWVKDGADFGDPMQRDDALAQPLAGRVCTFKVDCWGNTPEECNTLAKSVLRVCHRLGTGTAYVLKGETDAGLEGSGGAILGEITTLTISIRDDVTDDEESTVAPPNTVTPPEGEFT
jgi:hypothetical protein